MTYFEAGKLHLQPLKIIGATFWINTMCYPKIILLSIFYFCPPRKFLFLCGGLSLLLFSATRIQAQEEFIPPPSRLISTFPFLSFTGGVVVIKALLDDYPDSLNFILDTGSGGISLDSSTCLKLKIIGTPSDMTLRGIGGIRQVKFVYNQHLRINNFTIDSLNFHVNDYDILSSVYGDKIDGIIGYSFFSRYLVKIDYDSSKIYVYTKGYFKYPKGGVLLKPNLTNSLPVQIAKVRDASDITSRFYFDTGAGLCLLLSSDFVNDSVLLNSKRKTFLTLGEGLGGKTDMQLTTIKELKLGPFRFHDVPTCIFDDEYNITSYPSLGGLIGNDIFRRFNVYLNYDHREIYLIPNSHYRDPFDYSYTGLGLYWESGQIKVGDIMKFSPAEKAGFKLDDVVLAIDKNFSNNLQAYKTLLQNPGEKLKIIVKRNGNLEELTLKVKNIL
jgi:Aspartyl protease/PDZ domain